MLGLAWAFELPLCVTVRLQPPGWGRRGAAPRLSAFLPTSGMPGLDEHPGRAPLRGFGGPVCNVRFSVFFPSPKKVLLPVVAYCKAGMVGTLLEEGKGEPCAEDGHP